MPYQPATVSLLRFLKSNPALRNQIRAGTDRTLLYSGAFIRPMWAEIDAQRRGHTGLLDKQTLPDVLRQIPTLGTGHATLMAFVEAVERQVPWQPDGFTLWRALSGIFAANATGKVSFMIGDGVTPQTKVFAATEVGVLARNPHIDPLAKDVLAYYLRCIQRKQPDLNFSFISA